MLHAPTIFIVPKKLAKNKLLYLLPTNTGVIGFKLFYRKIYEIFIFIIKICVKQ